MEKNDHRGLSLSLVRRFAICLLRCLSLLSEEGIVHCDLKPVRDEDVLVVVEAERILLGEYSSATQRNLSDQTDRLRFGVFSI